MLIAGACGGRSDGRGLLDIRGEKLSGMRQLAIWAAVTAAFVSIFATIQSAYGASGIALGRTAITICCISALISIFASAWFGKLSSAERSFIGMFSLGAAFLLGSTVDHIFRSFLPRPPHVIVQSTTFQNTTVDQDMQWATFFKNTGGRGVVEMVNDIEMSSRGPTPETRRFLETFYFDKALGKMNDTNSQKLILDLQGDSEYTAMSHGPSLGPDWTRMADAGGVVYFTGVFRYIGHLELPDAEFCYFWVQSDPNNAHECLNHNTQ